MLVEALDLRKTYGDGPGAVEAVRDLNLKADRGEFIAVMGPSGSGKSTLLQLLGGLDSPTGGRVLIENEDIAELTDDRLAALRRRRIGFIFQLYNLVPVLTAEENVALPLLLDGVEQKDMNSAVEDILNLVGMADRRTHRPTELSGGEQQRIAIARALIAKPTIILADEPTGNLDSVAAEEIMALLRKCADELKQAIIMVTHEPRMAAYADRIIFLRDGELVDEEELGGRHEAETIVGKLGQLAPEEA